MNKNKGSDSQQWGKKQSCAERQRKKKCYFQSLRAIHTFNLNKNCLRNNWTKLTCRNVCSYIQPSEALKVDTTRPTWGGSSSESATLPATHSLSLSLSTMLAGKESTGCAAVRSSSIIIIFACIHRHRRRCRHVWRTRAAEIVEIERGKKKVENKHATKQVEEKEENSRGKSSINFN